MRFRPNLYRVLIGLLLLESFVISEPDFCEKPDGSPDTCERISPGTVAYDKLVQRFLNKHGMKRHLEEVCIEADVCYYVEDWIYSEQLYRLMISDKYIISGALLGIPKVIDDEMDTSKWSIDKGKLRFDSYTTAMIDRIGSIKANKTKLETSVERHNCKKNEKQ
ncbi:hypothetical protein Q1695_013021 [Nippostrongylus brasiliensis]|nr:hypothetical protein Q1695_013021 [Nippostrongylus brasiliensis]